MGVVVVTVSLNCEGGVSHGGGCGRGHSVLEL